jgi:hypothetical protein
MPKTITIPDPTGISNNLTVAVERAAGAWTIKVHYVAEGFPYNATIEQSELTAVQLTGLQNFVNAVVTKAAPKMGF